MAGKKNSCQKRRDGQGKLHCCAPA
uniref:Uncharacterized protein n=1 Tax=Rhizophora mucronata TaxID=61149 RepID=A0A2P2MGB2_RHIMU